jgi:hypothetical protein
VRKSPSEMRKFKGEERVGELSTVSYRCALLREQDALQDHIEAVL